MLSNELLRREGSFEASESYLEASRCYPMKLYEAWYNRDMTTSEAPPPRRQLLVKIGEALMASANWEDPPIQDYLDVDGKPEPYPSVYCLPQVRRKLLPQAVPLAMFSRNDRLLVAELLSTFETIEKFYALLGERNWIFHSILPWKKIRDILRGSKTNENAADLVESKILDLYDEKLINAGITHLKSIPSSDGSDKNGSFLDRTQLLWKARDLYLMEQWGACIFYLLATMDGAVNDFCLDNSGKNSLFRRNGKTIVAYDSYVGHQRGLSNVLSTANTNVTQLPVLSAQEINALLSENSNSATGILGGMLAERNIRRNGIMHGMLINFDNKILAAKAWNLTFSIGDWMNSMIEANKPQEPAPTTWQVFTSAMKSYDSSQKYRRNRKAHTSYTLKSENPAILSHPIWLRTTAFLKIWERGQWGLMREFGNDKLFPFWWSAKHDGDIKKHFEKHRISNPEIIKIDHHSYDFAYVHFATFYTGYLRSESVEQQVEFCLTWQLTDREGNLPTDSENPDWYLLTWDPWLNLEIHEESQDSTG